MNLKTSFLYPNASRHIGTSLGVASLGAIILEAGHSCTFFDATFITDAHLDGELVDFINESCCEVLFVHCTSSDWVLVKHLLGMLNNELGKNRPLTIVGGQHPTILPEKVLDAPGIDIVVIGEGELVLIEILDCLQQGKSLEHVKNCCYKKDGQIVKNPVRKLVENLDELPYPKWDMFEDRHRWQYAADGTQTSVKTINIETSRGCPYSCSFCMNSHYMELYRGLGKYCREKSAQRIISEATLAKETLGINYIHFIDDNFLVFEDRLEELSVLFPAKVGLPFAVQASADQINERSVSLLKTMGVDLLALGVESGNESFRAKILGKRVTDEQILSAIGLAKKNKIGTMAYYMVGLPFETDANIEQTIAFNNIVQPDVCIVSSFFPFPGTPLYREALEKNLIVDQDFGPDFFHVSPMRHGGLSEERLCELRKRFGKTVTFFGPLKPRAVISM